MNGKQRIDPELTADLEIRTERRPRRIKVIPPLPTMITLGNLFCGFLCVIYTAEAAYLAATDPSAALAKLHLAGYVLFLAMVFDALDGRVARITGQVSGFGGYLDCLADVVTFGVAAAAMTVVLSVQVLGVAARQRTLGFCMFYVLCCALRLARFHAEEDQSESGHQTFMGLPTPGAAAIVAGAAVLMGRFEDWAPLRTVVAALPFALPVLGVLMISRIRYPHVMNVLFRGSKPLKHFVFLALLGVVAMVLESVEAVLAGLAVFYVLTGPARIAGGLLMGRTDSGELEIFD